MITVQCLTDAVSLQSEDKLQSQRIRRDLMNNNAKNKKVIMCLDNWTNSLNWSFPYYINWLSMDSIYCSGYGCTNLPCGLKGDLLAGLLSSSSPAPSLQFGSDPQILSQASPQLYEPHTPLLTTKRVTFFIPPHCREIFPVYFFYTLLRLYHSHTGWNT